MAKIEIIVDYTENYAAAPKNEDIACVVTARTFSELQREMESALRDHIEWMREDGDPVPAEFDGEWEFVWQMTARAVLHYTEHLIPKAALAKATGINQTQLTHYATGYRKPRPAMREKIVAGIHSIAAELSAIS